MILDYFKQRKLSSSFIKHFIKKGEPSQEESRNLVLGNIIDKILTEGKSDFYFIDKDLSFLTGKRKSFVDSLYSIYKEKRSLDEDDYRIAYEISENKQKSLEQMIELFNEDEVIKKYWDFLIEKLENSNKIVITKEEEAQVFKCVKDINKFGKYFNNSFLQLEIYTEHFKIKPDLVYVENGVLHIKDLKTLAGFTENAIFNITRFRYDIQAYFYHMVMKQILETKEFECNNEEFKNLILNNNLILDNYFDFIFVSKDKECAVLEFKMLIEETKVINDKEYHTADDINTAIKKYLYCLEKEVEPNLTNYYLVNDNTVWI